MALDYEQYLSIRLKSLYCNDERYTRLRELIKSDKEVVFAVRKDEIHVYYLGGRILKITKSNDKLKFSFDWKYAKKKKGSDELNEHGEIIKTLTSNPYDVDLWVEHFDVLKRCMKNFRENVSHNAERQLQQALELENRDFNGEVVVVDNEYGVRELHIQSSKLCKVDLVVLFMGEDGKYKICLTELKKGDGATGGKAGIKDHIYDFKVFTGKRKDDIVKSVENLIKYKTSKEIAAIANYPENGIELDSDNIYISILCYDLSSERKIANVEKEITQALDDEAKRILPNFYYNLRMKERNGYTLSKADLLKN